VSEGVFNFFSFWRYRHVQLAFGIFFSLKISAYCIIIDKYKERKYTRTLLSFLQRPTLRVSILQSFDNDNYTIIVITLFQLILPQQ